MKQLFKVLTLVLLVSIICSCSRTTSTLSEYPATDPSKESITENQPEILFISLQKTGTSVYSQFYDQDFSNLRSIKDHSSETMSTPETYQELIQCLGEDGLIVAGYATGIREGHNNTYTLTDFVIEEVYYGKVSSSSLKIREAYCPVSEDDESYISYEERYTQLKDNTKTLLHLKPERTMEGVYYPIYYELPLPDDYAEGDEKSMNDLLDFYRGDKSQYAPLDKNGMQVIKNSDGTDGLMFYLSHDYWPESNESNEKMLDNLKTHILVQTAAKYNIKLWPKQHISYTGTVRAFSSAGIENAGIPE